MHSSALIVFSIRGSPSLDSSLGANVLIAVGGVCIAGGLGGGGAKGSLDCELVMLVRFWTFLDDSAIGDLG